MKQGWAAVIVLAGTARAFTAPALPAASWRAGSYCTAVQMLADGSRPSPLSRREAVMAAVLGGALLAAPLRSEAKKGGKGDGVTALSGGYVRASCRCCAPVGQGGL
jgi:hypothetical protein